MLTLINEPLLYSVGRSSSVERRLFERVPEPDSRRFESTRAPLPQLAAVQRQLEGVSLRQVLF